jgi:metal-responsive CopG/Arc/MetJ family transcriptional regulator
MNVTTVNISFQAGLLNEIDRVAKAESRSRSELLREAARLYIDRKRRWDGLFAYGKTVAKERQLVAADVASEIQAYRAHKAKRG